MCARECVRGRASGNGRCTREHEGGKRGKSEGRREGVRERRRRRRRSSSTGTEERRDKERTDETTGAGEKEITAGSDRVVEINVARLIGATEECACGPSGSQPRWLRRESVRSAFAGRPARFSLFNRARAFGTT